MGFNFIFVFLSQLQIVRAVCDVPVQLAPFLYPVIGLSTNINEPSHVYLLEDGLDLWLAVVENSPAMAPELLMLCENILPIIGEEKIFVVLSKINNDSSLPHRNDV